MPSPRKGPLSPTPSPRRPPDPLTELELQHMLMQLGDRKLPAGEDAMRLIEQVRYHLATECSTLMRIPRPSGRLIVVGDLHGHFNDLLHARHRYGHPSEQNQCLFNGDFVDRGVWGPEVLLTLFCMKLLHKNCVWLNRGNHESELCTDVYGFKTHLACAYPNFQPEMHRLVHESFNQLPLCYVVGGEVLVVHGGLPKFQATLRDIARLRRGPVPFPGKGEAELLFQALLWSDPKERPGKSDRGLGWHFSENNTKTFLERNSLKRMVRSHECVDAGYASTHGDMITTVFSASNYNEKNNASVAIIDSHCRITPGEMWNEEYVRAEWIEEIGKHHDFESTDLGNSADFLDFEVTIARTQGEKIGIELSMDHPLLELPVFLAINSGCISAYNDRAAGTPTIEVGDAIVEVNGRSGYDQILERLMSDAELRMRLRRPRRLIFKAGKPRPPLDTLRFPEDGFAYTKSSWMEVTRVDRIYKANGSAGGAEMYRALAEADEVELEVFRYAPADLPLKSTAEKREMFLRKASMSVWEDCDADQRAIDALMNRIGNVQQWACSTKERVLQELRSMIFMNRPQLLEAFTINDRADSYLICEGAASDWRGTVTPKRWAMVMSTTLGTPEGFPWGDLLPYLCEVQEDGDIAYVRFLMRFHNPLSRWLIGQWCEAALDQVVTRLKLSHGAEFDLLDVDGLGKLSYAGLKPFFRKHLFKQEPNTKKETRARELQYFALFSAMDKGDMAGSVTRQEFVRALNKRKTMTAKVCLRGHKLSEGHLPWWQGRMDRRQCDDCSRQIRRRIRRRWCDRCEFDLCHECAESREVHDSKCAEQSKNKGQRKIVQWHMVDKVLQILCASHADLWSVFFPAGLEDRSAACITQEHFVPIVGDLLDGDRRSAEDFFELLKDYLRDVRGWQMLVDSVTASAVVECLRVDDSIVAPPAPQKSFHHQGSLVA